ncbi:MAG: hypothetical protein NTV80_15285 [Verrucomicrobia bacterium]|nr:hypothetical protein [Verrucomicrobiota bacterium]
MPLLDRLESRFGRFAIPGLVQIVAGLKLLTFAIFVMQSAEARDRYLDFLSLDGPRILSGQVWRLVTYLFIPTTLNVLFAVLSAMMLMWLGRGLEQAWGAFRLNLFVRDRLHMAKVMKKRTQFKEASPTAAPFFHQCSLCQKTEVDDPSLYFRINDAGDEICSECRKST